MVRDDEEEILLSHLLADDTPLKNVERNNNRSLTYENESETTVEDDGDSSIEMDDYHSSIVERLKCHDATLQHLELCHIMYWDFEKWRSPQGDEGSIFDMEAWLNAIAEILQLAEKNPQVVRIEFMSIPINHPVIMHAITNLLTCDERIWSEIAFEECDNFDPRLLADAICRSSHSFRIRRLRLINSGLMAEGFLHLSRVMTSTKDLATFRITDTLDASSLSNISRGICANTTISQLDFHGCHFEDETGDSCCSLVMGLQGAPNLRTLSFAYCALSDHQMATLIRAVEHHNTLSWLDLSRNDCGPKTCHVLANLLQNRSSDERWCHLICLTMIGCGIGDVDLSILQQGIATPDCLLQHFYICNNHITDSGIVEFAHCMQTNRSLCSLWVTGNDFGPHGSKSLLQLLQINHELKHLLLDSYLPYFREIQFLTLLNNCGRKLLQSTEETVPLGLWPFVLERALLLCHGSRLHEPADVLFYFLQGPALCR